MTCSHVLNFVVIGLDTINIPEIFQVFQVFLVALQPSLKYWGSTVMVHITISCSAHLSKYNSTDTRSVKSISAPPLPDAHFESIKQSTAFEPITKSNEYNSS